MLRPPRIIVERLDARDLPAVFGTPWFEPRHLTLSFAPDGTDIAGSPSTGADAPGVRVAVLRAVQKWAAVASLDIGLVADGGQPFGTPGPTQGDTRFGDIRIGGRPLAASALALAIPPDPYLAGTWAGDIVLNSVALAGASDADLYRVAMHEVGHALGLPENDNPQSVLYRNVGQAPTTLLPADVAAVRKLYGTRAPDRYEGAAGNDTPATATPLAVGDGEVPAVAFGDITTPTDRDVFVVSAPAEYAGPVTVRVRTAGVSLLAPRVSVRDAAGQPLGLACATVPGGGVVEVRIPGGLPAGGGFVTVEAATGTAFPVGRYGLAVTFDTASTVPTERVDAVLHGPYDAVAADDLRELLTTPETSLFGDGERHDTPQTAAELSTSPGFAARTHYQAVASVAPDRGQGYFRIETPSGRAASRVLTAAVHGVGVNGTVPRVVVLDSKQNPIPVDVLTDGAGGYVVQATGLAGGEEYLVRVSGRSGEAGNYSLVLDFNQPREMLQTFAAGTVGAAGDLYVAQPQLFQLGLTATGGAVQVTITDAAGNVVFDLAAADGQSVSGSAVLLKPGAYRVRVTTGAAGPVRFAFRGAVMSDPVGPIVVDPTANPQYQDPVNPNVYLYPNGIRTWCQFLWVVYVL